MKLKFFCLRLLSGAVLILFASSSLLFAQIRESNEQNSERLDELRKQIEESSEKAQDLEEQARLIRAEISQIQQQLIKSAAEIQSTEDQIFEKEASLRDLRSREIELEESLTVKKFEMASTLGAMQRLSIQKTSVVAFKPGDALDTLRTTSLLRVILPDLKNRADLLQGDLSELNNIRGDITQQNIELRNELTKLVISNNDIDELLKKRVAKQKNLEFLQEQKNVMLKI